MTTTPQAPDTAAADHTLHARNLYSAHVIAGVLDAGLLAHAGHPDRLPHALWPDADPDLVQAIWNQALTVGIWAGKALLGPRWRPEELDQHQHALADAGFTAMARGVRTAASCGRTHPHPADTDTNDATVRGEHW
ncbi:hypothetical protein [Streptomyces sp. Ac-502]|uniref:hypothetical protein n=1 Tax=Streptomyces sp. Ac-502 TaxID=3342801 RepID=UPI003862C949